MTKQQAAARPRRWVSVVLWVLAFILMAMSAVYQRMTGPTHPLRGSYTAAGEQHHYKLLRSGTVGEDAAITLPDAGVASRVFFKRFKTDDRFTPVAMVPLPDEDGRVGALLPSQPMAGKLEYYIEVYDGQDTVRIPQAENVVIRFKGFVPAWALVPHVFFMFFAVLWAFRALFEALFNRKGIRALSWTTFVLMFIGGLILGPLVQYFAFGDAWTGVPFGWDLTDNKTLLMWLCWLGAIIAVGIRGPLKPSARWAVVAAGIVTVGIYLIPHSMFGSELDYAKVDEGVPVEEAITQG